MRGNWSTEWRRQEIVRLCHSGLDANTLRIEVLRRLRQEVPADAWCWPTADPATLLVTGSLGEGLPEEVAPRFFEIEYGEEDFLKFADLARSARRVGRLADATGGKLDRSTRWREIFGPLGFGDDLRVALVADGACWGYLALHRGRADGEYSAADEAFLAGVAEHLADGLRTALLLEAARVDDAPDGPGLLLLNEDQSVGGSTPAAEQWLADIGSEERPRVGALPNAVYAVAARLKELERGDASSALMPRARLRTAAGHWLVVHASRLAGSGTAGQIAIIIEVARPWEIAPVVAQAYDLSEREREVAQLVLRGLSTIEIAGELHISANTVQDHLKSIFAKVGVRSRRELVAQVFAQQYWSRMLTGAIPGPNGWFADRALPAPVR